MRLAIHKRFQTSMGDEYRESLWLDAEHGPSTAVLDIALRHYLYERHNKRDGHKLEQMSIECAGIEWKWSRPGPTWGWKNKLFGRLR